MKAAADVGLDADEVRGDLGERQGRRRRSSARRRRAKEAGIEGVPCFIFGGKFAVSGAQAPEYLAEAIERAALETARRQRSNLRRLASLPANDVVTDKAQGDL